MDATFTRSEYENIPNSFQYKEPKEVMKFLSISRGGSSKSKIDLIENNSNNKTFIKTPKKKSCLVETAKDYSSATTAHGLAYIVEEGSSITERLFWTIVVILMLAFCVFTINTIWVDWQENPVVTSLETVALSIEEVDFPAVTICPQGSVNLIMSRILMKQFKSWYKGAKRLEKLSSTEYQDEIFKFFDDTYPGTKDNPTKLAALMTSDNPRTALENNAGSTDEECDPTDNDKNKNEETCPSGFEFVEYTGCVHVAEIMMPYNEAATYCNEKLGSQLLYFDSYDAIESFNKYDLPGMFNNI